MYDKINIAGGRFKSVDYGKIPHIVFECLDGKTINCCDPNYIFTDIIDNVFITESGDPFISEVDGWYFVREI